ncbi:DNA repair protein RecO [Nordella sp. HKS 07]|uniref:DNA repair protein RecO n=1 Tax=Nordella sp. HKS 07 TaxID=2712222 RepID=UPI0013E16158|nr:DNA repair protein RecO [Nordella sp. HKS 07]QIG51189.1 DNA repair protein RecO [Nordella sp. HKS 07]
MEWKDEGIVLAVRRHGESSAIAELLTATRGRSLGLVRGGRSRQMRPVLQPGNIVLATWRARLEEHLGNFALEPLELKAGLLIGEAMRLAALTTLTTEAQMLPEREPHPRLYAAMRVMLDALENEDTWPALLVRWEMGLLDELGFGLDLARCAATGTSDDLVYVSPKTGRAVSRAAGQGYHDRLLLLPAFLMGVEVKTPGLADVIDGLKLTGYFLDRHVFGPRGINAPESRHWIVAHLSAR